MAGGSVNCPCPAGFPWAGDSSTWPVVFWSTFLILFSPHVAAAPPPPPPLAAWTVNLSRDEFFFVIYLSTVLL